MIDTTFLERYNAILQRNGTRLCVGLDTDLSTLPAAVAGAANPILEFNTRIIEATSDLCCAYKLNFAFYESAGELGMDALRETLSRIPAGVISIADAKRGDIGNTAERYAHATLEHLNFDAVTVNPYMGMDTLKPFFDYEGKCVIVLALTSNPGSNDFQRIEVEGRPLYMRVIDRCLEAYGATDRLGFVVGATHPGELEDIRQHVGARVPLLIPGLGAQGGDAGQAVEANGGGVAFFNVSRGIAAAGRGEDFAERARQAAIDFVEQLSEEAIDGQRSPSRA